MLSQQTRKRYYNTLGTNKKQPNVPSLPGINEKEYSLKLSIRPAVLEKKSALYFMKTKNTASKEGFVKLKKIFWKGKKSEQDL